MEVVSNRELCVYWLSIFDSIHYISSAIRPIDAVYII